MSGEMPLYMQIAWGDLDVAETPGRESNQKIVDYHAHTEGGQSPDEVSWCSSFVCACIENAGIRSTRSKSARSWLRWGYGCEAEYGAVCVLWRVDPKSWQGHVGFLVGWDDESVYLLGGNQSNRVRVSRYPRTRLLGFRKER